MLHLYDEFMASIKHTPSGTFQLSIKNRLLPKTLWVTFDSFEQAQAYGKQLEALLAQGIVPASLLERPTTVRATVSPNCNDLRVVCYPRLNYAHLLMLNYN